MRQGIRIVAALAAALIVTLDAGAAPDPDRDLPGTAVGWGACATDSDEDLGFCWALYNGIGDPHECVEEAPSDEFVLGCLDYLGADWPDDDEE